MHLAGDLGDALTALIVGDAGDCAGVEDHGLRHAGGIGLAASETVTVARAEALQGLGGVSLGGHTLAIADLLAASVPRPFPRTLILLCQPPKQKTIPLGAGDLSRNRAQ